MPQSLVGMVDTSSLGLEKARSQDLFNELLGDFAQSRRIQKKLRGQIVLDYVQKNCDIPSSERFKRLSISQARTAAKVVLQDESGTVTENGKFRLSPAPRAPREKSGKVIGKGKAKTKGGKRKDSESVSASDTESEHDDRSQSTPRLTPRSTLQLAPKGKGTGAKSRSKTKSSSPEPVRRSPRRRS